jgi:hypothetical protein
MLIHTYAEYADDPNSGVICFAMQNDTRKVLAVDVTMLRGNHSHWANTS